MNSLRTDDILGAKPRVRHMPKNLIRQRKIPTYFLPNLQPNNPQWDYQRDNHLNYSNDNEIQSRIVQHQNNDPNGIPFYSRNHLTKEPKYVNYDFIQDQNRSQRYQQPRYQPQQNQNIQHVENVKNSQHVDMIRASSENRYKQIPKQIDRSQQVDNRVNQSVLSNGNQNERYREQARQKSRTQSRKSLDNRQNERKSIFRGLGFNIISNHKYQYTFQHKIPTNN